MAEKIIYEIGLDGVSSMISNIHAIQEALSSLHLPDLTKQLEASKSYFNGLSDTMEIGAKLREASKEESKYINQLIKAYRTLNRIKAKTHDVGGGSVEGLDGVRNNFFTTQKISPTNNSTTTWGHEYASYGITPNGEWGANPLANGAMSHFAAEFRRAMNRNSGDWGTLRQRARSMLMQSFGYTPLLGWDTGAGFTTGEIGATSMKDNLAARDSIAKIHREYFRDLKSKFYAPTVWQGGAPAVVNPTGTSLATLNNKYGIVDTGNVTDPGYVDAEWSYAGGGGGATSMSIGNVASKASLLSKLMGLLGKLNLWATAIQAALRGMKFFIDAIKKFIKGLISVGNALAEASWRQLRESFAYGMSINSLAMHERAIKNLGGDAASASALLGRFSKERSMLAYGGNGGAMMEAARLFGIGIMGSGEHGFATNDEFIRNIISVMSKSSPERRVAIANTLGLTPYQTWAFSKGQAYYDYLTRNSLADNVMNFIGGERLSNWDKEKSGENALRFKSALGGLGESMMELGKTLGDIILPSLTKFIDLLAGIAEIVNYALKPLSWMSHLFSRIDPTSARSWWYEVPTKEENQIQAQALMADGRSIVINVGDVNMPSLPSDISSAEAADRYAKEIFNRLGEQTINNRR